MIAFYDPPPQLSPDEKLMSDQIHAMSGKLHAAYLDHVNRVFTKAILDIHGDCPSAEEMEEWCQTFIGQDGTHYLLWKAPEYQAGDPVDMSYVIASVPPPKVFKCEPPDSH